MVGGSHTNAELPGLAAPGWRDRPGMGLRDLFPGLGLTLQSMSGQRAGVGGGACSASIQGMWSCCRLGAGASVTKPCFPAEGSGLVKQTHSSEIHPSSHISPHTHLCSCPCQWPPGLPSLVLQSPGLRAQLCRGAGTPSVTSHSL